jgi:putative membrane protein
MNKFQSVWSKLANQGGTSQSQDEDQDEVATVQTAQAIAKPVLHRQLTAAEKKTAGPAVHYAFGTGMGALYGVAAEVSAVSRQGVGTLFGAGLWLGADEIAAPAFGLAKPVTKTPISEHAYALVSHLVYGMTAEGVRRLIRKALG